MIKVLIAIDRINTSAPSLANKKLKRAVVICWKIWYLRIQAVFPKPLISDICSEPIHENKTDYKTKLEWQEWQQSIEFRI